MYATSKRSKAGEVITTVHDKTRWLFGSAVEQISVSTLMLKGDVETWLQHNTPEEMARVVDCFYAHHAPSGINTIQFKDRDGELRDLRELPGMNEVAK